MQNSQGKINPVNETNIPTLITSLGARIVGQKFRLTISREKRLVYGPLYETYTSRIRIYDFLYGRYTAPYTTPYTALYRILIVQKTIYPCRVSIRIVYVSYNGSYTKHFFTGFYLIWRLQNSEGKITAFNESDIPAGITILCVNESLKFCARDDFRKWPEILPLCVSAINLSALRSGCSATEALYGMRPHFPGSFEPLLRHKSLSNFEKNRLSKRARIMQKRLRLWQSQAKTFNRGKTCPTFRPGQKVYVVMRANSTRRAVKFCAKFRPAVNIEGLSPVIYSVKQLFRGRQRKRIAHISMINPSFKRPKCLHIPDDRYLSVSLVDVGPCSD